ncbi:hypothetical protein M3P05_12530 [Sansalvadorimonas sp. 2012CJ34-2]|uniref:Uncharacterized protein n=1 Tax=Parendozoicomonas callyspongiae TaxID=2942213 RepID=A0ABT0PH94_9GAMM|nr:hypothetical protein [Sansalvadorimonas sp. 2012CJ34-2]MCL6270750.1 hypothetical protein [Sansalvadorimonas sp. 2012CJ34-2]
MKINPLKCRFIITLTIILLSTVNVYAGTYTGKVRPYFWNDSLYLEPLSSGVDKPSCVKRRLLRLKSNNIESVAFTLKYSMLLSAWMNNKEVKLHGTNECTSEGDEIIYAIVPM